MIGIAVSESKPPRRGSAFKVFILISIIIISVSIFWYFVLPSIWEYERLEISSYASYYWVVNSLREVRQLVITFINNGTQELTIEEIWTDGVLVDPTNWEGYFGKKLQPEHTSTFYVAPKNSTFEKGRGYNLTIVTSRKNRFNFALGVNENNTKTEKVKINHCYFYYWPPLSQNKVVGIEVKSLGGTNVIIKEFLIDNTSYAVSPRLWLNIFHSTGDIEMSFPWKKGSTYTATIETVAGSTDEITATAD